MENVIKEQDNGAEIFKYLKDRLCKYQINYKRLKNFSYEFADDIRIAKNYSIDETISIMDHIADDELRYVFFNIVDVDEMIEQIYDLILTVFDDYSLDQLKIRCNDALQDVLLVENEEESKSAIIYIVSELKSLSIGVEEIYTIMDQNLFDIIAMISDSTRFNNVKDQVDMIIFMIGSLSENCSYVHYLKNESEKPLPYTRQLKDGKKCQNFA